MTAGLRPFAAPDTGAFLDVLNEREQAPQSLADFQAYERARHPSFPCDRWVWESGGRIVAIAQLQRTALYSPDGWYQALVKVSAPWRGAGAGGALLDAVETALAGRGGAGAYAFLLDDDGDSRAWAERRGYALHEHRLESILDLARYRRSVPLDAPPAPMRILSLAEDGRPDRWERLAALYAHLMGGSPGLDGTSTSAYGDFLLRMFRDHPRRDEEAFFVAADGDRWVGTAFALHTRDRASELWSQFAGVDAAYRGRGLARALKLRTIAYAVRHGFRTMRTFNLASNAPMIHVNRTLGFEPTVGLWWMRKARSA